MSDGMHPVTLWVIQEMVDARISDPSTVLADLNDDGLLVVCEDLRGHLGDPVLDRVAGHALAALAVRHGVDDWARAAQMEAGADLAAGFVNALGLVMGAIAEQHLDA